jgi:putative transposase
MSKQAYTFRLYPTRKQIQTLTWTVDRCRELYNAALQERRDAFRMVGKSITYYDQAKQLPDIKDIREEYRDIHSQMLQDVLRKADKAFQAFFARCKRGGTPGFPRFKGRNRFDSFTIRKVGILSHMIIVSASRKSVVSSSSSTGKSREPSKPLQSNARAIAGMLSFPAR